jgi:hypothetical protein
MARKPESPLIRALRRGENIGLIASLAALMLVEAGCVVWLERLPLLPSPSDPVGFLDLPFWYERPKVEVTLLLTILGGTIASAANSIFGLICNSASQSVATERRAVAHKWLKTAVICAIATGADLLFIQFFRT